MSAAVTQAELDPVLNFSQNYKGMKLSEVPADFLQWCVRCEHQLRFGRYNWKELCAQELRRRMQNQPIPVGMPVEDLPTPTMTVSVVDGVQEIKEARTLHEEEEDDLAAEFRSTQINEVMYAVFDAWAMNVGLQKSFYASGAPSLTDWLSTFAEEAYAYGKGETVSVNPNSTRSVTKRYGGYYFTWTKKSGDMLAFARIEEITS